MGKLNDITDIVRSNVQLMVDSPGDVKVECQAVDGGAYIHVAVSSTDFGRVLGKQGRNARALRLLASAMGMAAKLKISLTLDEVGNP